MALTSKLTVYNGALREIGAGLLANTTTVNSKLTELESAFDHAVELTLASADWSFARRRATLSGVADTSFPPFTRRLTKPADYLRKCWVKNSADDESQVDHAEVAAVFYAFQTSALLEYISDDAANYEPANWPPHFTRVMTLHLAALVAPRLARAGAGEAGMLDGKLQTAMAEAERAEAIFLTNTAIPSNRLPVMRRALEFMGQVLAGSVGIHDQADKLRWAMNRSWTHSVRYVLEQGAWNFASKRSRLTSGVNAESIVPSEDGGVIDGYSVEPDADDTASTTPLTEWTYGYPLPSDFLHKIWLKRDPNDKFEIRHQFIGAYVFANEDPVVMEYVSNDAFATDPDNWSANFLEAVAAYLALSVAPELVLEQGKKGGIRVDASMVRQKLEGVYRQKLSDAKLRDAIQQYPYELPPGRLVMARLGGGSRWGAR